MALDKLVKDIPIGSGGLNLKADPKLLPEGQLVQADNVIYTTEGRLIVNGSLTSSPNYIFSTKEQNIGALGSTSFGNGIGTTMQRNVNGATIPYISTQPVSAATTQIPFLYSTNTACQPSNIHYTYSGTKIAIAWDYLINSTTNQYNLYWGVWDTATSSWSVTPRSIPATGTFAGAASITVTGLALPLWTAGGYLCFNVQGTNAGNNWTQVAAVKPDLNAGTVAGAASWQAVAGTGNNTVAAAFALGMLSTCIQGGLDYVAWGPTTGSTNALIFKLTGSTTVSIIVASGSMLGSIGQTRPITLSAMTVSATDYIFISDTANFAIFNGAGGTVKAATANSLGGGTGTRSLTSGITIGSSFYAAAGGTNAVNYMSCTNTGTGLTTGSNTTYMPFRCASKIFVYYSWLVWLTYSASTSGNTGQKTYVLYDITNNKIAGRLSYLAASNIWPIHQIDVVPQSGVTMPASYMSVFYSAGQLVSDGNALGNTGTSTNLIQTISINVIGYNPGATSACEIPFGTLTSGLAPVHLTNTDAYELGFSFCADNPSTPPAASASAGNVNGTVSYACATQYTDSYGQIHWSAPTYFSAITVSSKQVTLTTPYTTPGKGIPYWFRTTNGGTIYYQLGPHNTLSATCTDNQADSSITGNPTLYTTGGEAANDPPPAATIVAAWPTRAFVVSAEDQTRLYYSKPFLAARGVEFNVGQYIQVAPHTGKITGLAVMDDKLIIFKQGTAYVLAGDGPNRLGQGSFYGPSPIAVLSGCQSQGSIVVTDEGVYFQSARGIMRLNRDLSCDYVGLPLDSQMLSITSGCSAPQYSQVIFSDSANQCFWVYDTICQRWAKSNNGYNSNAFNYMAGNASTVYGYTGAASNIILGGGSVVVIKTGWIRLSSIQGFARLYRLILTGTQYDLAGQSGTPRTITIGLAYDYNSTVVDTLTYTFNPTGVTTNSPFQFRSRVPRQVMEAVQFTITLSAGSWAAFDVSGLALEYGVKSGVYKLSAANSV